MIPIATPAELAANSRMKHGILVLVALMFAVVVRADGDFTKTMTPEEITDTGLSKLSPEELARLKAIIERYRSGEVAVIEKKAEAQVAAVKHEAEQKVIATKQEAETQVATVKKDAETKVAAAETRAKEAETKATAVKPAPAAEDTKKKEKSPSWVTALITLKKTAEEKPDKVEAIETRIAGEFTGWRGRTTFRLDNGQIWQQVDGADYVGVRFDSPKVSIKPGVLGTFWMKVEGVNPRVKVKPIKLE